MTGFSVRIAYNLNFDMSWFFNEFFHVHIVISKSSFRFLSCRIPSFFKFSFFQTARIPFPPPPADAFSITGYPFLWLFSYTSSKVSITPSLPGTQGTPLLSWLLWHWLYHPYDQSYLVKPQ